MLACPQKNRFTARTTPGRGALKINGPVGSQSEAIAASLVDGASLELDRPLRQLRDALPAETADLQAQQARAQAAPRGFFVAGDGPIFRLGTVSKIHALDAELLV
eukprot:CAMPEP_0117541538 /NCGR_PEP_ID=MMETSP0784-20121206/44071_1 /TAXON_ID=39447 /ORGANISM="" /LENGTH=104 /DNA_ID=CAMNT_0005338237 /DNA_START=133 /DNA_END=448 /DNA_ORIENTATION=-